MSMVTANPCDALERPKVTPAPPRGLSAEQVRGLLAVIPQTPTGLRDRALILTLVLTGRRRAEVLNLRTGDLSHDDGRVFYEYRGKGGKRGRRELPEPAYEAIVRALAAFGKDLAAMGPSESLWPGVGSDSITSGAAYLRFRDSLQRAGLPPSGLHVLRHTAANLRRDAGESVEMVSAFLDHSSLAVTSTYLRRLEGQEDIGWASVAQTIGA